MNSVLAFLPECLFCLFLILHFCISLSVHDYSIIQPLNENAILLCLLSFSAPCFAYRTDVFEIEFCFEHLLEVLMLFFVCLYHRLVLPIVTDWLSIFRSRFVILKITAYRHSAFTANHIIVSFTASAFLGKHFCC